MLVSIVTAALAQASDMVFAGQIGERDDLVSEIRLKRADRVMLQATQPGNIDEFVPLLQEFPKLKVVAITSDGSSGFLHELRPFSMRLTELSADVLQSALRAGSERRPH